MVSLGQAKHQATEHSEKTLIDDGFIPNNMARQATAVVFLLMPVFLINALRLFVTPFGEMLEVSMFLDVALHIVGIIIGIVLYRKTTIVRDHEWRRSKAVKSVSHHFKAEEGGVWEKDIQMDSSLSEEAQYNLKGQVSSVTLGKNIQIQEIEDEVDVEMLIDSDKVRIAQARLSGDEQFDENSTNATYGAVRQSSPMDRFLDWIANLRGKDKENERLEKSKSSIKTRSKETPVIAQRPIAPITPIPTDRKNPRPMEISSMTDEGIQTINIEANAEMESATREPTMEELAYGISQNVPATNVASASNFQPQLTCRTCNSPNPIGERICSNCGSNL